MVVRAMVAFLALTTLCVSSVEASSEPIDIQIARMACNAPGATFDAYNHGLIQAHRSMNQTQKTHWLAIEKKHCVKIKTTASYQTIRQERLEITLEQSNVLRRNQKNYMIDGTRTTKNDG